MYKWIYCPLLKYIDSVSIQAILWLYDQHLCNVVYYVAPRIVFYNIKHYWIKRIINWNLAKIPYPINWMEKILDVELKTGRKSCGLDAIIQSNVYKYWTYIHCFTLFFTIRVVQNYYCTNLSRMWHLCSLLQFQTYTDNSLISFGKKNRFSESMKIKVV